jgi:hypothetical protein
VESKEQLMARKIWLHQEGVTQANPYVPV